MISHPIHPATVHFPIAFLSVSYGLDALYPIYSSLPSAITDYLPSAVECGRISYYSLALGLLTSLPAVSSGVAQALKMVKAQGIYEQDKKTIKTKVKVTLAHAVVNDIVIAASAYSWWCKRQQGVTSMLTKGVNPIAYEPENWQVGLSVALGVFLLFAANLGGSLVYDYGMGLAMGKKVIKKDQ